MTAETTEKRVEVIAAAMHCAWFAFEVLGRGMEGQTWEKAPEWQKKATRHLVGFLEWLEPESVTFDYLCRVIHFVWFTDKKRDGWSYGEVLDPEAKKHPALLDYDDLPAELRKQSEAIAFSYLTMRYVLGAPQ